MGGGVTIATSGLVLIVSWIIGDFFDAFREIIIEFIFDRWQPLWWDFFYKGNREKADQLEDYYYSYYELNINITVAIVFFLISELLFRSTFVKLFPWYVNILILPFIAVIFFWDALILRSEIKKHLDEEKTKTK